MSAVASRQATTSAGRTARRDSWWRDSWWRASWWWVWGLPALATLAIGSIQLGHRQLWRDELATWLAAQLSYPDLAAQSTRVDAVHAPYYAVMRAWVALAGDSEIALRLPSLLAAAVAAGATAEIGRRCYGPYTGLLAGLVLAVTPAMSRYAQEARQYAAVVAMVSVATLLLIRLVRRPTRARTLAYGAALAAAALLHVLALLVVPSHLAYLIATRRRAVLASAGAAWVAVAVLVAPLVWYARRQTALVEWIPPTTLDRTLDAVSTLSGTDRLWLPLAVAGLVGLALSWDRRGLLIVAWAMGPFLVLLAAAPVRDLLVARYVLFALPAWCLLAAHGLTGPVALVWRWARRARPAAGRREPHAGLLSWLGRPAGMLAVAIVAAALLPPAMPEHQTLRSVTVPGDSDVRRIAGLLAGELEPGDAVAIHGRHPWWIDRALAYYLPSGVDPPVAVHAWTGRPPSGGTCPDDLTCLDGVDRLWLVNGRRDTDPLRRMAPELREVLRQRYRVAETIPVHNGTLSLLVPR